MKNRRGEWNRREFLKQAVRFGAMACLASEGLLAKRRSSSLIQTGRAADFYFRTVSLRHLSEMRQHLEGLDKAGRLSANKTWRRYIGSFQYEVPKGFAGARSLIIMATPLKIARMAFNAEGRKHTVLIPAGYVDDGRTLEDYQSLLAAGGIVRPRERLERARLPLKQLAVRSGLAVYGRNNITYIEGYGSLHQLLAFYSEQTLADHWGPSKLLRECKGCSICLKACPTGAIRESDFIIDPARCLTLYNELPDPIPPWLPASGHNALMGCLKCQYACPGNEDVVHDPWDLGEVSAGETAALLSGRIDEATRGVLKAKFKRISGGDDLAYIARNLKLVLDARGAAAAPGGHALLTRRGVPAAPLKRDRDDRRHRERREPCQE